MPEMIKIDINIKDFKGQILNIVVIFAFILMSSQIYRAQMNKVKSLLEQKEKEIKKKGVLAEINQTEKSLASYGKLFGKKDRSLVINTINVISRDLGIKVNSIKPEDVEDYSDYILKYPFRVAIIADNYHAIGRFIQRLETYPDAYYIVGGLKIEAADVTKEGPKAYKLAAELIASGFSLKE